MVQYPVRPLTFVSHFADSRRVTGEGMCTLVLVIFNCIGSLSLPMNSEVALTDRPQIFMDVKQQNSKNQAQL